MMTNKEKAKKLKDKLKLESKIIMLKNKLKFLDYMDIKNSNAHIRNSELEYNPEQIEELKAPIRDKINMLENELKTSS